MILNDIFLSSLIKVLNDYFKKNKKHLNHLYINFLMRYIYHPSLKILNDYI